MIITNWLNKPFPRITSANGKVIVSLLFGLFIYIFLLVFQPFGIENISANKTLYLIGFGLITALVLLFTLSVLPFLFPKPFDVDKWNIKKAIAFILLNIILITILNYEYNTIVGSGFAKQYNLFYFVLITFAVGVLPVILMVFMMELFLTNKHQKTASDFNIKIHADTNSKNQTSSNIIKLESDLKKDNFEVDESNLVFIKSEDNYCMIFYREGDEINNYLLRTSLKKIENQLELFPHLIRCHRSFIVNKKRIKQISGNARAYYLHFENCYETVAVSRNFKIDHLS